MVRLHILCEGQTEERFIKDVFAPYLQPLNIHAIPIILKTKQTANKSYRGGVSKYSKIRVEIENLCRDSTAIVTTMLDYYKLPNDTPGKDATGDIYEIAQEIEAAIKSDIGEPSNLIVNLTVHEFEGLLFSDVSAFQDEAKAGAKHLSELGVTRHGKDVETLEIATK